MSYTNKTILTSLAAVAVLGLAGQDAHAQTVQGPVDIAIVEVFEELDLGDIYIVNGTSHLIEFVYIPEPEETEVFVTFNSGFDECHSSITGEFIPERVDLHGTGSGYFITPGEQFQFAVNLMVEYDAPEGVSCDLLLWLNNSDGYSFFVDFDIIT